MSGKLKREREKDQTCSCVQPANKAFSINLEMIRRLFPLLITSLQALTEIKQKGRYSATCMIDDLMALLRHMLVHAKHHAFEELDAMLGHRHTKVSEMNGW